MTELDRTLPELARVQSRGEPIVSLYLDVRWKDEQQRERVRLFVRERARQALGHYLPGSPGRDGLARTLAKVAAYVSGLAGQAYAAEREGLALFACESPGLWRPLFFGRAFESELCTDAIPHLRQLARLAGEVLPALVVAPSQEGADVLEVTLGDVAASWAPRTRRAAAAEVTLLSDRSAAARVVLVGTAEAAAAFERELPERVRARVVARVPRPRGWEAGEGRRRDGARALAEAAVARRGGEAGAVARVVGEALRGGLGVLGPDDVVLALNEGRVHTLVIEEDFQRTGWRCDNCGAIGEDAESAERCPFCAGDVYVVHELGEALVARALAEGARVEVVAHTRQLHRYRGVGAFLRQTAATGLRGASQAWPTAPGANQPEEGR